MLKYYLQDNEKPESVKITYIEPKRISQNDTVEKANNDQVFLELKKKPKILAYQIAHDKKFMRLEIQHPGTSQALKHLELYDKLFSSDHVIGMMTFNLNPNPHSPGIFWVPSGHVWNIVEICPPIEIECMSGDSGAVLHIFVFPVKLELLKNNNSKTS